MISPSFLDMFSFTLPETNIAYMEIDGWKTAFLLGLRIFRRNVSFRECRWMTTLIGNKSCLQSGLACVVFISRLPASLTVTIIMTFLCSEQLSFGMLTANGNLNITHWRRKRSEKGTLFSSSPFCFGAIVVDWECTVYPVHRACP